MQLDREGEIFKDPGIPRSSETPDNVSDQLSHLKVKRNNLTIAPRRETLKAKLLVEGEIFDNPK